jgi:O-antigen ligase
MIAAHPLLGVGPDGYRLSYGLYSRPRERSWDVRIYANSLPLELAADIGLAGAALFLAFVVAAAWPLAIRSIRSGSPTPWEAGLLAALAALFAHGMVDYLLGSRSMSYLFWILLGLIATSAPLDRAPGKAEACASE